eukprot:8793722-Alexandrium_andersonii.AAC.1
MLPDTPAKMSADAEKKHAQFRRQHGLPAKNSNNGQPFRRVLLEQAKNKVPEFFGVCVADTAIDALGIAFLRIEKAAQKGGVDPEDYLIDASQ